MRLRRWSVISTSVTGRPIGVHKFWTFTGALRYMKDIRSLTDSVKTEIKRI